MITVEGKFGKFLLFIGSCICFFRGHRWVNGSTLPDGRTIRVCEVCGKRSYTHKKTQNLKSALNEYESIYTKKEE